jgi:hypothetical protein
LKAQLFCFVCLFVCLNQARRSVVAGEDGSGGTIYPERASRERERERERDGKDMCVVCCYMYMCGIFVCMCMHAWNVCVYV